MQKNKMSNRGFNLPVITNIPVEEAAELDIREARDLAYIKAKSDKIKKGL